MLVRTDDEWLLELACGFGHERFHLLEGTRTNAGTVPHAANKLPVINSAPPERRFSHAMLASKHPDRFEQFCGVRKTTALFPISTHSKISHCPNQKNHNISHCYLWDI